ncbi:MAG: hydroxyacid dehydrogenase [Betaproteobacteria bacterium]|nr:hydroxyacid dehydrogenase [Betaproteobacteria bacterium]
MRILFRFDASPALIDKAVKLAWPNQLRVCPESEDADYERELAEAETLWHVLKPVSAAQIALAPNLKLIQKIGTGVNTIDLEAAKAREIAVCNLPGANSRAVAEMALLLMLACLRRLRELDASVRREGGWPESWAMQDGFGEIGGRTVGLVGFGAVPQMLAPWLSALGAKVVYASRTAKTGSPFPRVGLEQLLAQSDIVSLHVPLTPETNSLFDARALRAMKRGAILVNTARGALVDETALAAALRDGRLAAAALDVFGEEPLRPDHPLLALPNVVATPHLAWLTQEMFDRCLALALDNSRRLKEGLPLLNRVA